MKTLNLSKWIITAGLTLAGLFTLPAAQASVITWIGQGTISDDTFLTNAGPVANEVYGFDNAAAGSLTTANGYTFANANFTIAGGGASPYSGYLNGQTSGDAGLNAILANGAYGSQANNSGTLLNLTIGVSYTVLAFIDDNRGSAAGGTVFQVNGAAGNTSPAQLYGTYGSTAGNPLGGYIVGTFVASATTQAFSVQNSGQNGSFSTGNAQYNGILLISNPPPLVPLPLMLTNTQPASAAVGLGGQAVFTAAFSNSPPVSLQWQFVSGGVTNPVTAADAAVVDTTNSGVVVSTLTFTNLQVAQSGSYLLKALNATNSLGFVYSAPATLAVIPLIQWLQTGTFSDDTFLALAGSTANEVYGVDFGAGAQTTLNGYTFADAWTGTGVTGNMGMAGAVSQYNGWFTTGTTGDSSLDNVLTCGLYGAADMVGALSNLVAGQTYNVLVILDDTRTGAISAPTQVPQTVFYGTDGVSVSPYQPYVFPDATNASGGASIGAYALGTFTAESTTEPLSVLNQDLIGQFGLTSQYNAILVEKATTVPPVPPIYLNANTFPIPANAVQGLYWPAQTNYPIPTSTAPLAGEPAQVNQYGNIGFSAAYVGYGGAVNLQWQGITTNGVTNNINAGVVNVTNLGIVTSTLTLSNVQSSAAGSYQLKAVNATNNADVAYSTPYPLLVTPIVLPTPPTIGAPRVSGGNLILTGTGGTPNSGYTLLTTTNLTNPLSAWTTNLQGTLDGTGAFSNSIPIISTTPAQFFQLRLP